MSKRYFLNEHYNFLVTANYKGEQFTSCSGAIVQHEVCELNTYRVNDKFYRVVGQFGVMIELEEVQ